MNYLLDKLPQAVLIDGKAVPIHTDFRVCLRVVQALEDERLMEHEIAVNIAMICANSTKQCL